VSWTYYYYILIIGLVAVAARGRRAAILIALAAAALAGNKDPATNIKHHMFLTPDWPIHTELQRKLRQITSAEVVVICKIASVRPMLELWPEFREALNGFELAKSTPRFLIYVRKPPVGV
jgi:hypothetical protein